MRRPRRAQAGDTPSLALELPSCGAARRIAGALLAVATALAAGCSSDREPNVVSATFLDDQIPDGTATPDETIVLLLDRPISNPNVGAVRVAAYPEVDWTPRVVPTGDPRVIHVVVASGTPGFRFRGVFGRDAESTGLRIDLGDGRIQEVDLEIEDSLPVLERAIWEDRGAPGGNLVVDRGDVIRLAFDRPVRLNLGEGESHRVRAYHDVILSKANDRLEDGEVHATFDQGDNDREILIVLGSRPVLTVGGALSEDPAAIERFLPGAPSGIALAGTSVIPMPKIVDRRGGRGSISLREVDLEYPEGFPLPRDVAGLGFPSPGERAFASLTPTVGGRAVLAGGLANETRQALDQVLLFDPFQSPSREESRFVPAVGRLPSPSYHHTATRLPGADDALNTGDDLIVVAGGTDGTRVLDDLSVLRLRDDGGVDVVPMPARLRAPRAEHAAVALPGNRVLIDGGRSYGGESRSGIVGLAEVIRFGFEGGEPRVTEHRTFRSLPRMQHSLTLLGPTAGGVTYVLAYGGYGQALRRLPRRDPLGQEVAGAPSSDLYLPTDEASVLVSAVLLDPEEPPRSLWGIELDFSFALLRRGHSAFPLGTGGAATGAEGLPRSGSVLIVGGTLRHVIQGFDGGVSLWEMPLEVLPDRPRGHEAANALVFRLREDDPSLSTVEVVPHPSPDPGRAAERVHFAAVAAPGGRIVLFGGEDPGAGEIRAFRSAEVFLQESEQLAELAVRLEAGRSRHQAYSVDIAGVRSLFLIGGMSTPTDAADFAPVVEIPLP